MNGRNTCMFLLLLICLHGICSEGTVSFGFGPKDRIVTVFLCDNNWPEGLQGAVCSSFYYRHLADPNISAEQTFLRSLFMLRPGSLEYNPDRALVELEKLSDGGDIPSLVALGRVYLGQIKGLSAFLDAERGISLMTDAHEGGSKHASAYLSLYYIGEGDVPNAIRWYQAGFERSSPVNGFVGYYLERKLGEKRDDVMGNLLQRSAAGGYLPAIFQIGLASQNQEQRKQWLFRALNMGYRPAGIALLEFFKERITEDMMALVGEFIGTSEQDVFFALLQRHAPEGIPESLESVFNDSEASSSTESDADAIP